MRNTYLVIIFVITSILPIKSQEIIDSDVRIQSFLNSMTIEEKAEQLGTDYAPAISRLNIPAFNWHNECLHGLVAADVTVFPISIGLAATFNTNLIHSVASAISDEARVLFKKGRIGLTFWSPNGDLIRDPRWGRCQETFGEDPFLASRIMVSYIKGLQGEHPYYLKAIASPKHFAVHSGPESKRHTMNMTTSQRDFWEFYLEPFRAAIQEGKSHSIMASYTAYNKVPASVNPFLLTEILRDTWGFDGFTVSDCGAVGDAVWGHWFTDTEPKAVAIAMKAGLDIDCGHYFRLNTKTALDLGYLSMSDVDTSLSRLFRARFRLGLFNSPDKKPYMDIPDSVVNSFKHRTLAIETARQSIVLLKNESNTLPLKKNTRKLFLCGPLANAYCDILGSYHGWPNVWSSVNDGIRNAKSNDTKLVMDDSCALVGNFTELIPSSCYKTPDGKKGLLGEYYDNSEMKGSPVFTKIDSVIDIHWERNSPISGSKALPFSVRWKGKVTLPGSGPCTFKLFSNDGSRLFINGEKKIDSWWEHGFAPFLGFDTLEAGVEYDIVIEYFFTQSYAKIRLEYGDNSTGSRYLDKVRKIADSSDVIVFAGGISSAYENEQMHGPFAPGYFWGDRTTLDLPESQLRMLKELKKTGKPIVLVLMGGSCLAINWEKENIPAIIHTWYAGQDAGIAIADVVFGNYNPAGRLPNTWYKSTNDLPDFDNYYMYDRSYRFFKKDPLFEFGYGLSYSKFEYSNLNLSSIESDLAVANDTLLVDFDIKNTGNYDGDEVPQLYVVNLSSKFEQPIKSLKGFSRIPVKKGLVSNSSIKLPIGELAYYDSTQMKFVIDTGLYELQVGASSQDIRLRDSIHIKNSKLSIKDTIAEINIELFPNPAIDNISFKLKYTPGINYILKIYDILGREISGKELSFDYSETRTIDCSDLDRGIYIFKLTAGNKTICKKFILSR